MANISDKDREKAARIVEIQAWPVGLAIDKMFLPLITRIAQALADQRAELHRQVREAVEAERLDKETQDLVYPLVYLSDALSAIDRVFEDGNKSTGK